MTMTLGELLDLFGDEDEYTDAALSLPIWLRVDYDGEPVLVAAEYALVDLVDSREDTYGREIELPGIIIGGTP